MKVLVTGGAGFIGSHLVDALIARGDEVIAVDDLSRGSQHNISCDLVEGDACDIDVLREAVEILGGCDLIHHLAAVNGTRLFHEHADIVIDVNINSTIAAIELASEMNSRLVIASSPEAWGTQEKMPLTDDSIFTPANLHQRHSYGASKYLCEVLVQHAVRTQGLDARIIRPFNAYGPRSVDDENGQVIAMMLADANSGVIHVHGDGSQTRSFTWIDDIVAGIIEVGCREDLAGRAFNLGSLEEISMLELAQKIQALTNAEITYSEPHPGDSPRRLPDLAGNQDIEWQAQTNLDEGLSRLLAMFSS